MKFDYSPVESAPRRSAHRVIVMTALCVVAGAALVSRETVAKRQPLIATEFAPAPLVNSVAQYEQALQDAVVDPVAVPVASDWMTVTVEPGENLSSIFTDSGLIADDWVAVLKLGGDTLKLKRLDVGDQIQLRRDGDRLQELVYIIDEARTLHVRRNGEGGFESDTLTATLDRHEEAAGGTIKNSLFADGQKAGLSDRMIMELAEVFGYDVDFALDLRQGDRFSVLYESLYRDGEKVRNGDILAAEFVNQGKTYRAVRHVDADGHAAYYTPEGQSLKKAFIRAPLDVIRISSPFNLARRHPILNTIRAHKGVDYAAPAGTPIKAAGDGKVEFVGVKNGYGNVVILQHGKQYETLYAHMSRVRPGLKSGQRVDQGQIIGYVGMTGLATAPHLHYEFRINGGHVNPVTVALPRANPLSGKELAQFNAEVRPMMARLDTVSKTQLAERDAKLVGTQ